MARRRVVIVGASDGGRIVAYNLSYDRDAEVVGFVDADRSKWGRRIAGFRVLGPDAMLPELRRKGATHAVVAAGEPALRRKLRLEVRKSGLELGNAIHPSVLVSPAAQLGKGVVILARSVLSDNPVIGDNVWIGLAATITHDTRVGRDCLIGGCSAVGAYVTVGDGAMVGWGAVVGLFCKIGAGAAVGSGANVASNSSIPARAVAVGNPARVVKKRG
jgi:sugar O-acyltransferase (sialic acid O-acetyltransferase NeuD family)